MVRFLFLAACVCFGNVSFSQIKFYNQYLSQGHDTGEGIVQLPDSSYVVCGTSTSFSNSTAQAFLMKIDSLGNHKWAKNYGGDESELAKRVFHIPNEGFYVAGYTNAAVNGDFNFYFFHTDVEGNLLWEKQFGTENWDILNDAIMHSDSSFLLVGETYNPADSEKDGYLIRLDKFGDTLWTKSSNYFGSDTYNSVADLNDTAFVVAGRTWNSDSSMFKAYIACFDYDGTLIWENQYGNNGNFEVKSICIYNNQILAVGNNISTIYNTINDYGLIVTNSGNESYYYVTEFVEDHAMDFIAQYGDTNTFLVSNPFDNEFSVGPGQDLYIAKFNEVLYNFTPGVFVSGSFDDITGQIISTSDKGAVVVGTNNSVVEQVPNVFVLKMGPNEDYPSTAFGTVPQYSLVSLVDNYLDLSEPSIYPNPARNEINISFHTLYDEGEISFVNPAGQIVYKLKVDTLSKKADVSFLDKGVYILKMSTNNGLQKVIGKLVLQ